ncbi:MAG: N-acetyltransferase [Myxococcales bacterium]|nr:N-acetyltransferase [Myxococcales bacterium]
MNEARTNVVVRKEQPFDVGAVRSVNLAAFPGEAEANLVDELRANGKATLSLVAVQDERVIGHILFSAVTLDSHTGQNPVLGLAPMAVLPALHRQGVGSLLVTAGLDHCKRAGVGAVVVLGHADYYPRFGFRSASAFGVSCEYDVPDENFMLVELAEGAASDISGVARYQPEFANA